jgi:hypothetical protein
MPPNCCQCPVTQHRPSASSLTDSMALVVSSCAAPPKATWPAWMLPLAKWLDVLRYIPYIYGLYVYIYNIYIIIYIYPSHEGLAPAYQTLSPLELGWYHVITPSCLFTTLYGGRVTLKRLSLGSAHSQDRVGPCETVKNTSQNLK